jgi:Leucine-rich repeat (LRR) protein
VSIGDLSFKLASNLEYLYLPSSIKHIGIGCFHRCYNLNKVEIDADVINLNERMFKAAINLKTAIISNQNIRRLESEAFDDCYSLSSISFANKDIEIID